MTTYVNTCSSQIFGRFKGPKKHHFTFHFSLFHFHFTINFSRVVPSYLANDDQRLRRWCAGGRRSLARQYTLLPYWKRPLPSAGLLMTLLAVIRATPCCVVDSSYAHMSFEPKYFIFSDEGLQVDYQSY